MSKQPFTVIIRSSDKISGTNTNDCTIKLYCPPQPIKLKCKVISFFLNSDPDYRYGTNTICELYVNYGLDINNGNDTKNTSLRSLAFIDLISNSSSVSQMTFILDNFNNRVVNFQLRNSTNTLLKHITGINTESDYSGNWVLILECEEM